jgi:hypothetical protein
VLALGDAAVWVHDAPPALSASAAYAAAAADDMFAHAPSHRLKHTTTLNLTLPLTPYP